MSAIFGLWRFDGEDVGSDIDRMDLALARYGSDECGTWRSLANLALGRRLHRTVPEDRFPTSLETEGRYVVVADVRLTEREDLARQLNLDLTAARMSDAAMVAAALDAWGEQAFDRIYGSFAIAAWDRREQRLLLARDPMGQKPLFFHSAEAFFAFASMPSGLHALPQVRRGADIESISRFLALEALSPGKSHYDGIGRIMPGQYSIVTSQGRSDTRYWNPNLTPLQLATNDDYAQALGEHLDRAVAAALRGVEKTVGAHLSSGFDSTTVATTAARHLAQRGGTVVAYTAAPREGYSKTFPHRGGDESILAGATAAMHPNMEHVVVRSARTPMENLDRTESIYAAPVFNICNQTWYDAINDDAATRGINVILEAPMGNSTISETGFLALPELVRSGRLIAWLKLVAALRHKGALGLPSILWKSFRQWVPGRLYRWLAERRHGPLVSPSRFSPLRVEHLRAAIVKAARESDPSASEEQILSGSRFRSTDSSVADRLLGLSSDDSGAVWKGRLAEWKIDYRDPTADRRLVEFSLRVPAEQLIHNGEPRALLRKVLADRVPGDVLDNRARGYQLSDWHELLDDARQEVAEEVARIESFEPSAKLLDVERLKALLDQWPERGSDEWIGYAATIDYRCCLLRAISAASFMRHASGDGP
jgi:asparagine synthase (glutamine-hydrolysing)